MSGIYRGDGKSDSSSANKCEHVSRHTESYTIAIILSDASALIIRQRRIRFCLRQVFLVNDQAK